MSLSFSACSLIDDDTNCVSCNTRTFECHVHVSTRIDSLLTSQIHGDGSEALQSTLASYYLGLFNVSTRSVGFGFYDVATGDLLDEESRTMQGNDATFSIGLPKGNLRCVAVSPDSAMGQDSLVAIQQPQYSGRLLMKEGDSRYSVNLYPVDAQVALVARADSSISAVSVTAEGLASSFSLGDSIYHRNGNIATQLTLQSSASTSVYSTYAGTLLPSFNATRANESSEPWRLIVLATTATGSVTRTVLTISKPLLPADIRVLMVSISADGAARTTDSSVGATVTLDWKSGGEYNPDI